MRITKLILAASIAALLAAPAAAQFKSISEPAKSKQGPKKKADDKEYNAAIEHLPDQKFDPWRNMR